MTSDVFCFLKKFVLFALTSFFTGTLAFASDTKSPVFAYSVPVDASILGGGLALTAASYTVQRYGGLPEWDGKKFDISDVNAFDRWAARPYNRALDYTGTGVLAAGMILPAAVFGTAAALGELESGELPGLAVMYAESLAVAFSTKNLLKYAFHRVRPYMYFDTIDSGAIDNFDFELSWPSGHTTNAFMSAGFLTYVFAAYYPTSQWRIPLTAVSYAFAAGTGVLRILSGNHFITDVLSGAVLGTLCGIGIPFIHRKMTKNSSINGTSGGNVSVAVSPLGFNVSLKL